MELPADCLTVIAFNGKSAGWGVGTKHTIQPGDKSTPKPFALDPPKSWLSAVTFLSVNGDGHSADSIYPKRIVVHVGNTGRRKLEVASLRLRDGSVTIEDQVLDVTDNGPSHAA